MNKDKKLRLLLSILMAVILCWMYAAVEPFIYYWTGWGFIYNYNQNI